MTDALSEFVVIVTTNFAHDLVGRTVILKRSMNFFEGGPRCSTLPDRLLPVGAGLVAVGHLAQRGVELRWREPAIGYLERVAADTVQIGNLVVEEIAGRADLAGEA